MKIGVAFTEVAGDPGDVRKFVQAADALGYSRLFTPDHVVKCPRSAAERPLYREGPVPRPARAVRLRRRAERPAGVRHRRADAAQRQTVLVAQQAADVDLLSRERLRLGVGIGWNYVEYDALDQDFKTRATRFEERIGFLRQLWTTPLVTFAGRFDRIDRAGINPRPRRKIPVWLGGHSESANERGARLGDGFVFAGDGTGAVAAWARVRHHLAALGRAEDAFGAELLALFARDAQAAVDHLRLFRDAGGTHGVVSSMNKGFGGDVDARIAFIAEARRLIDAG